MELFTRLKKLWESGEVTGCGSYRYMMVTLVMYLIASALWLKDAYLYQDGAINYTLIFLTVVVFAIGFLLCFLPGRRCFKPLVDALSGAPIFLRELCNHVILFATSVTSFLIFECFTTGESIRDAIFLREGVYYLRYLLLLMGIAEALYLICNRLWLAVDILTIASILFSGISYYVYLFRGSPLMPWDFLSFGTGLEVSDQYQVVASKSLVYALLLMLLIHQLALVIGREHKKRRIFIMLTSLLLALTCFTVYATKLYSTVKETFWSFSYGYETYGMLPSFLTYMPYMTYHKPDGYQEEAAAAVLDGIDSISASDEEESAVNIIMIMNESLSDLRCIGDGSLPGDYMPYMDSLKENTISGYLFVPTFGGNTCNTEFEVLTGASYQYVRGIPYVTFMKRDRAVHSLLDNLMDFQKEAFHPFWRTNWNRDVAYDDFGFESFYDIDDVDETEEDMLRVELSDASDFSFLIDMYENREEDHYFMFNVTMQNHSGYTEAYDNFTPDVDLSSCGDFPEAETYLSLVKKSDQALKTLIDYFSQVEEPTIICMWGDHQAQIETEFYEYLYGKSMDELTQEEKMQQYMTPYFIWANYDIEEEEVNFSANYLGMKVLKAANLDMNAYESYLAKLYEEYPVISAYGLYDSNGKYYDPESAEYDTDAIKEYQQVQYYYLNQN